MKSLLAGYEKEQDDMDQFPTVAILILNWNNYQDTKKCLDSLSSLSYPRLITILVDNGSSDDSGNQLALEYPDVHSIFNEKNLGFAGGNNIGIRYIMDQGIPYILLLNNDTEVINPGFLEDLVQQITSEDVVAAVGPRVHRYDSSEQDTILPYPTLAVTMINTLGLYRNNLARKQYVDSISGCCVMVRSSAIRQVGLMDDNIFFYGEETEWFYRMRKSGWKIAYIPVDSILHKGAASSKKLEDRNIYIDKRSNTIYTLVKHQQYFQAILTAILTFMLLLVRILFSIKKDPENKYNSAMVPELIKEMISKWKLARSLSQYMTIG